MKIGVLSDTHVQQIDQLPPEIVKELHELDMIIHVGDYIGKELFDELMQLGNFHGVCGNMDPYEIRSSLPEQQVIEVNGKRLGLIHGWGGPWGIQSKIQERFEAVDAIIYGHTHAAHNEIIDGVLFFNPGSATGRLPALSKTYGIITISASIQGEIIVVE